MAADPPPREHEAATAAPTLFATPFGSFHLQRFPARKREPLFAWCGADTLLLQAAHARGVSAGDTLVVNDAHGALSVALNPRAVWTDSALSAQAIAMNTARNLRPVPQILASTVPPPADVRVIVLRIPRQLPYLSYQLCELAERVAAGTTLLAAGMDKHLSPRTAAIIESLFGPVQRHPGRLKARLFVSTLAAQRQKNNGLKQALEYYCDALDARLSTQPNVFSPTALDNGSRLLIENLQRLEPAQRAIDLACGSGVIGLSAYRAGAAGKLLFCDESAMAVRSACENAARLFPQSAGDFSFFQGDGLADYQGPVADLILCNPPFHMETAVDAFAGRRLLHQAGRYLDSGGRLCLVANRHLDYLPVLRRHFQRVQQLAQNRKFRVYLATKG